MVGWWLFVFCFLLCVVKSWRLIYGQNWHKTKRLRTYDSFVSSNLFHRFSVIIFYTLIIFWDPISLIEHRWYCPDNYLDLRFSLFLLTISIAFMIWLLIWLRFHLQFLNLSSILYISTKRMVITFQSNRIKISDGGYGLDGTIGFVKTKAITS